MIDELPTTIPIELRRVDELLKPTSYPDVYRMFKELKRLIDMIAEKMGQGKESDITT